MQSDSNHSRTAVYIISEIKTLLALPLFCSHFSLSYMLLLHPGLPQTTLSLMSLLYPTFTNHTKMSH